MPIGEPILGEFWVENATGLFHVICPGSTRDDLIVRRADEQGTMWLDREGFLRDFSPGPGVCIPAPPKASLEPFWARVLGVV